MQELWQPVAGYEGSYEVSSEGRIRSLDRLVKYSNGRHRTHLGRVLKPVWVRGYAHVNLGKNGKLTLTAIHRIVGRVFLGPAPGPVGTTRGCWQIDHADDDKTNNRASNLQWMQAGPNNSKAHAKLTVAQVRSIRNLLKEGVAQHEIARQHRCHQATVSYIKNGKIFAWVA